ncbi:hypothetical protein [Mycolicibacterium conceptionense]|uniref:hypothetical protein n=1 Tax=Mycolicibacterium conceptionense TaxID=451644 RepID=UPI000A15F3C6|nr:hypothetical protein [Mycolicibacterium conceptionense]
MTDVVERAKAVLAGVTEGPWSAIPGDRYYFGSATNVWTEHGRGRLIAGDLHKPNAEFIAQARTLVPELVAEVERLREGIERVRDVVHEHATRGIGQRILDALAVSDE